jgi:RNA polymerase sigma factor (sigma-70 family)
MEHLIGLIREYQASVTVKERRRLADTIICAVGPKLDLHVYSGCPLSGVDDVVQNTLIGVAKGLLTFKGKTDKQVWAWCYRIADNKIADELRLRQRAQAEELDESILWKVLANSFETAPVPPGVRADLEYALKLLVEVRPPCRNHLWDFYVFEYTYREIAKARGMSTEAVRKAVNRCLALAQELILN